jgi:peptidoglycan/LPS O-acetylase OafA/YrhL
MSKARDGAPPAEVGAPPVAASRVFELDILRGVAIFLVLTTHSPSLIGESGWLRPVDLFIHQFGWTGVDLFFVLSGYLIGRLLFSEIDRHGSLDVGRFLLRRMLRIWPAYYILLAFAFLMTTFTEGGLAQAWSETWRCLIHVQNFKIVGPRDHLWTLAVEEHFYLALPLYLAVVVRKIARERHTTVVRNTWLVLAVVCLGLRIVTYLQDPTRLRYPTYLCIDALFFGVYLAQLRAARLERLESLAERRWLFPVALALMVPAALFKGLVRETIGFTGLYLGYGLVLVGLVHRRRGQSPLDKLVDSKLARWTAALGTSSYSIYLWHREIWTWRSYEFGLWAGQKLGLPQTLTWALHTVLYVVVGAASGMLLERVIETPVLALRNRLFPPRTPASPPAPAAFGSPSGQSSPQST